DKGNSVIVGHREGWGGAFHEVDTMKVGDLVVVQTQNPALGPRNAVFKVISIQHTSGGDIAPFSGSTDHRLTIVAGDGGEFASDRVVVTAVSGPAGKVTAPPAGMHASTSAGSRVWNAQMLLALIGIGGALVVARALRRRYRPWTVVIAVAPLAAV